MNPAGSLETCGLQIRVADRVLCRQLDLKMGFGQVWCLLGRNGSGKTTLLHTLAGLRPPASGKILLNGTNLDSLRRRQVAQQIGVLFQDHSDPFPATVLETALTGRHPYLGPWERETSKEENMAVDRLKEVELDGLENRSVATLSGGERRRLGIATLLTQDPPILLLDEPSNHLDLHHQIRMLELLTRGARQGECTILMILHDVNLASRFADHFLLLFGDGETLQGERDAVLRQDLLERLYAHPMEPVAAPHGTAWLPG